MKNDVDNVGLVVVNGDFVAVTNSFALVVVTFGETGNLVVLTGGGDCGVVVKNDVDDFNLVVDIEVENEDSVVVTLGETGNLVVLTGGGDWGVVVNNDVDDNFDLVVVFEVIVGDFVVVVLFESFPNVLVVVDPLDVTVVLVGLVCFFVVDEVKNGLGVVVVLLNIILVVDSLANSLNWQYTDPL